MTAKHQCAGRVFVQGVMGVWNTRPCRINAKQQFNSEWYCHHHLRPAIETQNPYPTTGATK